MGEVIFHGFLLVILGLFYWQTTLINTARVTDPIGPAGFPGIIIILTFILVGISTFKSVKKLVTSSKEKRQAPIKELDKGFLMLVGAIILFVLLVNYIGFLFSSALLIASILIILGQRSVVRVVVFTILASLVFTLVFGNLLSVPLPRGVGIIRNFSQILY